MNPSHSTAKPPSRAKGKPAPWLGAGGVPIPGWFTAPCRAWKQMQFDSRPWAVTSLRAPNNFNGVNMVVERERRAALGIGWGSGRLEMPNTPTHKAPKLDVMRRFIERPAHGEIKRTVAASIREQILLPDGMTCATLAAAVGLENGEAATRISQFRKALRDRDRGDLFASRRRPRADFTHYFATAELLAAWVSRQVWK